MTWGYYWCRHCNEKKRSEGDMWEYDGDVTERCCNKSECCQKQRTANERVRQFREEQERLQELEEEKIRIAKEGKKQVREELLRSEEIKKLERVIGKKCHGHYYENDTELLQKCDYCGIKRVLFESTLPGVKKYWCAKCYLEKDSEGRKRSWDNEEEFDIPNPEINNQTSSSKSNYNNNNQASQTSSSNININSPSQSNKDKENNSESNPKTDWSKKAEESRIMLDAVNKIEDGEKIDIDNLPISEESKQELHQIKKEFDTSFRGLIKRNETIFLILFYSTLVTIIFLIVKFIRKRKK